MANLKRFSPEDGTVTMTKDSIVEDLIVLLGIDPELVQMVFVDGSFTSRKHSLADVKKVILLPSIGGG